MVEPEIVNAVGGGDLNQELDLQFLFDIISAKEIRYEPEHWPGLYIRLNEKSPAVMVFRTGKYNIAGAESIEKLNQSNEDFLSTIENVGIKFNNTGFNVRNLVFIEKYERELDLNQLAVGLGLENTEYEPGQFPGLLYRTSQFTGTFLLFKNAKVILTGVKNVDESINQYDFLFSKLNDLFK
jgi:transcription initiation factor TFIID TATA-box-binding protein